MQDGHAAYGRFAAVYDKLMSDIDRAAWAEYVQSFLPEGRLNIIDAACGTGALSIPLALMGHSVTAIDSSSDMLELASKKARAARANIAFVSQDITHMRVHRKADAVVSACDGVNYLASVKEAGAFFLSAYECLKPGGLIIFDISSRYKLEHVLGMNTFASDEGDAAYIWQNAYDEETKLIEMDLTFFVKSDSHPGLYERFLEKHIQRAHSEREIVGALKRAGFTDIRAYRAFTREADDGTAERLEFVAAKRSESSFEAGEQ